MWTMTKKEFRENLPWFAIGLIAMLYVIRPFFVTDFEGAINVGAHLSHYADQSEFKPVLPLMNSNFLSALGIFVGIYGVALALLQTLREERAGTHAFVLAGPISRTATVGAKLGVGVSLYLLATCPAFCWAIYWTSVPGHFPSPFRWWMTLDGWQRIAAGLLFYLGAFLTGVRPARWYGTRLVGLMGAVVCLGVIIRLRYASPPVLAGLGMLAAGALLVWAILASFNEREF